MSDPKEKSSLRPPARVYVLVITSLCLIVISSMLLFTVDVSSKTKIAHTNSASQIVAENSTLTANHQIHQGPLKQVQIDQEDQQHEHGHDGKEKNEEINIDSSSSMWSINDQYDQIEQLTYLNYFRLVTGLVGSGIGLSGVLAIVKHTRANYLIVHGALSALFLPALFGFLFAIHACTTLLEENNSSFANSRTIDGQSFMPKSKTIMVDQDLKNLKNLSMTMIFVSFLDTIVSFVLIVMSPHRGNRRNLAHSSSGIIYGGASYHSQSSQPKITGLKPRQSVVFTLSDSSDRLWPTRTCDPKRMVPIPPVDVGMGLGRPGPRPSISGPVKFSQAARRDSSFI